VVDKGIVNGFAMPAVCPTRPPIRWVSELLSSVVKRLGREIPLQAWTGSEVSRSLRFPDFKTADT
jgi:hypothetical protein